jgi:pimeloyl-ACP methyl ester carboxylesterase
LALGGVLIVISVLVSEAARQGLTITRALLSGTPVTQYIKPGSTGPLVVVAHGFAGSEQMMQGYALPLARAGYRVAVFEFQGHGRNSTPMSGDVDKIEGTTRRLVEQTNQVINALARPGEEVALLGHSMATDVLVRVAAERPDVGPMVLVSAFSQEITATFPDDLLLITGAWEGGLRGFAREAVEMVQPGANEAQTVTQGQIRRRAYAAPFAEHVSVLQSRPARAEALAWLDQFYGHVSDQRILPTGWAILAVLTGWVLVFNSLVRGVPERMATSRSLTKGQLAVAVGLPMIVAPVVATSLNIVLLPVLVADYLLVHLLIFGALQLGVLWFFGLRPGRMSVGSFVLLLLGCAVFGVILNRYAANFWPTPERLWIIALLMLGAVPYMLADAMITFRAHWSARVLARTGFLASLALAVSLDFSSLFFLIMIAPVLVLFHMVFGTMGRHVARRSGPLASGLALGLVLAWALGVSFPLFQGG